MTHTMPLTERLERIRNSGDSGDATERQDAQIERLKTLSGELFDLALEMRTEFDRMHAEYGGRDREVLLLRQRIYRLESKIAQLTPNEGDDVPW